MRISSLPWEQVARTNEKGKKLAERMGLMPVSPVDNDHERESWGWADFMLEDLKMLASCDAMLVLCSPEEAKTSYGVQIEILWAEKLGLPVMYTLNIG